MLDYTAKAIPAAARGFGTAANSPASALKGMSYAAGTAALSPSGGDVQLQETTEGDGAEAEVKKKVKALIESKFGGDYAAAFEHYVGSDMLGTVSELSSMLKDAGIGNFVTRPIYASKIMARFDTDGDGKCSLTEFETGIA